MAVSRGRWLALGGGGAFALLLPALLLSLGSAPRVEAPAPSVRTVVPPPVPPLAAIYERDLFAATEANAGGTAPADAPALVGIAGRLNRDAVALVRLSDGSSRSLKVGESVDGWRLESLAIDAAFFTRGRERVRVDMAPDQ
jgi:hypothetical protein